MERYPLSWPAGWPRTPAHERTTARFSKGERVSSSTPGAGSWMRHRSVTIADGIQPVLDELGRLGVADGDSITSTNVPTRLDGRPYSGGREPDDPGVAVYWRMPRQQQNKCMAIDRYDRVADNLAAVAATLDAMRAIERHGGASILDRAFTGFDALPAPGSLAKREWWDVLECRRDATLEVVRAQYMRLRSDRHPDKGGSEDAFNELTAAWKAAQESVR